MSFSLIYMVMNIGYLAAGYIFDFVRRSDLRASLSLASQPTTHQQLFMVSLAIEIVIFPAIYFLRRGEEEAQRMRARARCSAASRRRCGKARRETIQLFGRLVGQSAFARIIVFFLLIGFLKAIFLQMDYVFPKFGDRAIALRAPVGKLANINGWMIILLVPVVGALTQRFSAYRMVIVGGAICAAGVFIMALPTAWFVAAANSALGQWLGHSYLGLEGAIHPYYIMAALYLDRLLRSAKPSIRRAFTNMPPPLRRKARKHPMARSLTSRFSSASFSSGHPAGFSRLLSRRTARAVRNLMWLIFACAASVAPIGLILFSRYIRVPEEGRDD